MTLGKLTTIILALVISAAPACADGVFTTGNHPANGEENILFHPDQSGTTIDAFTNRSDTMVQFSSTTDILVGTGGQSDLDAKDGQINDVTFTVPGHTFSDFILDPQKLVSPGDLLVTAATNDGTFTFSYGDNHGNNFLTITTTGGEEILSVTVDSASGFAEFKQPRVSGISDVTLVPEPSTFLLLGSGLVGLATILRKKML